MTRINPEFIVPPLSSIPKKRRKMSPDKALVVLEQVQNLLDVGFIHEVYSTWLSNVIMVKKSNRKWRMCVDYTNLNKVCQSILTPC